MREVIGALSGKQLPGGRPKQALHGSVHPDFIGLATTLQELLQTYSGGAAICVYHRGESVVDIWGGERDAAGRPWLSDTMAPSFSTTKGVAATLLHIFVDRGRLSYDDRVASYWPEFGQQGKERITIRQVLLHQSGLYHIRQMIDRAERMTDWDHMIHAIESARPIHEPGQRTGYHGLTFGFLVGEILQRVSGKKFPELVREEIAEPLGLDGMYVGAPEAELGRAAELTWRERGITGPDSPFLHPSGKSRLPGVDALSLAMRMFGVRFDFDSIFDALAPRGIRGFDFNSAETLRASIPAANGLFTARSLARMYAALAEGGELDGVRLLSRRTLAHATKIQDRAAGRAVIPFDMGWRLGYHGVATTRGIPKSAFGHFGLGGSGAWADPRRRLAVALIVNSGIGTPFGDLRILRVGGAALKSVECRGTNRAPVPAPEPDTGKRHPTRKSRPRTKDRKSSTAKSAAASTRRPRSTAGRNRSKMQTNLD
jgi:CubicO group peptidase (beta-lactamase class C family)